MAALFAPIAAIFGKIGIGGVLSIAGSAVSGLGALQAGRAQAAASEFQAKQLEAAGLAEQASSQRQAQEDRRQKEIVISRARAVGAASGGGQDIPLLGAIEEEGELRALTTLWVGDEAAKGRQAQAAAARFEGKQYKRAGFVRAATGVLGQAGQTFAEKFG